MGWREPSVWHRSIACNISVSYECITQQKVHFLALLHGSTSLQWDAYLLTCACLQCSVSLPRGTEWWRASRFLPFWRISEWAPRWTLRRASPRRSCSHRCYSYSQSSLNISLLRFRSLWHISWLVSPRPCCLQPSRSLLHAGDVETEK